MTEMLIDCPNCGHPIELTEALAGPMLEAERRKAIAETERRLAVDARAVADEAAKKANAANAAAIAELRRQKEAAEAEVAKARDAEVAALKARQEAEEARRSVEIEVARRVAEQTAAAASQARDEAVKQYAAELVAAQSTITSMNAKLTEAQAAEIAARHAKREAEAARREAELHVERRLDEERSKVRELALKERDDEYRLKMLEKERQLADLKQKLDEAQRKADQGSQQLKGDVLEVDLCDALSSAFPGDEFERVKKGQKGGDVIHTVRSPSGLVCGRIKWEGKHTQNWSDSWLSKIREDQRAHKCDLAAIATETLPDGVAHFAVIDDVWVSAIATALPMAAALRRGLIDTYTARRAAAGADSSKDQVYRYLTGTEFRSRVRGVVEPVVEMRTSLESEKRAAARQFAVREKQLERMGISISGMYGDLQGLVGPSLPTVDGLALPEPQMETPAAAPKRIADDDDSPSVKVH